MTLDVLRLSVKPDGIGDSPRHIQNIIHLDLFSTLKRQFWTSIDGQLTSSYVVRTQLT